MNLSGNAQCVRDNSRNSNSNHLRLKPSTRLLSPPIDKVDTRREGELFLQIYNITQITKLRTLPQ